MYITGIYIFIYILITYKYIYIDERDCGKVISKGVVNKVSSLPEAINKGESN